MLHTDAGPTPVPAVPKRQGERARAVRSPRVGKHVRRATPRPAPERARWTACAELADSAARPANDAPKSILRRGSTHPHKHVQFVEVVYHVFPEKC